MKCPHCEGNLSLHKKLLAEELVTLSISWEGDLVEAQTIGGVIENTRKLLASAAKGVGIPSDIFMHGIDWEGDAKQASFTFLVMPRWQP